MSHELLVPADALARINMLFRSQQKVAATTSGGNAKESHTETDVAQKAGAEAESTNGSAK